MPDWVKGEALRQDRPASDAGTAPGGVLPDAEESQMTKPVSQQVMEHLRNHVFPGDLKMQFELGGPTISYSGPVGGVTDAARKAGLIKDEDE